MPCIRSVFELRAELPALLLCSLSITYIPDLHIWWNCRMHWIYCLGISCIQMAYVIKPTIQRHQSHCRHNVMIHADTVSRSKAPWKCQKYCTSTLTAVLSKGMRSTEYSFCIWSHYCISLGWFVKMSYFLPHFIWQNFQLKEKKKDVFKRAELISSTEDNMWWLQGRNEAFFSQHSTILSLGSFWNSKAKNNFPFVTDVNREVILMLWFYQRLGDSYSC